MKSTLVRHSAWTAVRNPQFKYAVETAIITGKEIAKVEKAGGIVVEPSEIYDIEYEVNYPSPDRMGITPRVKGSFSRSKINGQEIYIPPGEEEES